MIQCCLFHFAVSTAAIAAAPVDPAPVAREVAFVASRHVALAVHSGPESVVDQIELWVTTDGGRTWTLDQTLRGVERPIFRAPRDGRYGFLVRLRNAAGDSGPAPRPGATPQHEAIVDTTPPLVQLHAAQRQPTDPSVVMLHATIIEEHLGLDSPYVFYRHATDRPWIAGGRAAHSPDGLRWRMLSSVSRDMTLNVCIVVVDHAGNRTMSDPVDLAPVEQPTASEVAEALPEPEPTTQPVIAPASPSPEDFEELQRLRREAAALMQSGQPVLARRRLEDAHARWPQHAGIMVDLGRLAWRTHNVDEAQRRLVDALEGDPDNAAALESLAAIANAERRYRDAEQYLERSLQSAEPSAWLWLRLGDVKHRQGRTSEALQAWQQATTLQADSVAAQRATRRLAQFSELIVTSEPG